MSSFQSEDYRNYRTRLLLSVILPIFILPLTLSFTTLHLLSNYTTFHLSIWTQLVVHFITLVGYNTASNLWRDWKEAREAHRLGARIIPRVKTNWPGNVDILLARLRGVNERQSYLMQGLEKLTASVNSTTFNLRLLWTNQILTVDEGVVKYVLATGFEHFDKGVQQKEIMETFLGNGIFNRDGEIWRTHRAMTRPFFVRERVSDFDHFETYSTRTINVIESAPKGEAIDVQDLFARFTLDTASAFLFGTEMDTLSLPLPRAHEAKMGPKGSAITGDFGVFANAFEAAQQVITKRARARAIWKFFELFSDKSTGPTKIINDWLDPVVDEAIQKTKGRGEKGGKGSGEETSFLEYLAMSTDDKQMIREELLNILLASRDTTASMLSSVIYLLTQHPDVFAQLRAEILSVCPGDTPPTYETLREMKYLRAVLNETLRLFPPVPGNTRATRDSPVLLPTSPTSDWGNPKDMRPMYMPAVTAISYSPMVIHKREDLWGPDAHEFDPMRWLNDGTGRLERMVKNPLMFVPFNAGPRICLGQQFALNEASYFLVRLLQTYDGVTLDLDAQPLASHPPAAWKQVKKGRAAKEKVWHASAVTMFIKGGLWVKLHKAEVQTV